MNNNPLFSILIANYNNGVFLEECINSVFKQTYTNWEIVIVDDGSEDPLSTEIYNKFDTHPKIIIFYNEKNMGCGFTKRNCVEKANGEICAFLDPDDAITSDALEIMVEAHVDRPTTSLIYSQNYLCDSQLRINDINTRIGPIPEGRSFLNYNERIISHFASFKKDLYNLTRGLNPRYKRAIDHDLYFKLEEVGSTYFIEKPLYFYRQHSNSISLNKNRSKALYWDLRIKKDAYLRRKKTSIPNISTKAIGKLELDYYLIKAIEKSNQREYCKMYYCLSMAAKFAYLDKKWSILRISITPIKRWLK